MLVPNGLLILGVVSVGPNTATCIHYLNSTQNTNRLSHSIGVLFSITKLSNNGPALFVIMYAILYTIMHHIHLYKNLKICNSKKA